MPGKERPSIISDKNNSNNNPKTQKKKRLNKTGSTEFVGFSAFANPTSPATALESSSSQQTQNNETTSNSTSRKSKSSNATTATIVFIPSPIYITTFSSSTNNTTTTKIQTIFKKILKKDSITKCRALQQLRSELQPQQAEQQQQLPKKEIVAILSYFLYLFETKLAIDNSRHVRHEVLQTLYLFQQLLPKAFLGFLCYGDAAESPNKVIGLLYCMAADPAAEVKKEALAILKCTNDDKKTNVLLQDKILHFLMFVLKHIHRPSHMPLLTSVTATYVKTGNDQPPPSMKGNTSSNVEKEEVEERFERILLSALHALASFVQNVPDESDTDDDDDNNDISVFYRNILDISVLQKQLTSSRPSFRKATYHVFICIIQHCPITALQHQLQNTTSNNAFTIMQSLLLQALQTEKEKSNQVTLFEWLVLYLCKVKDLNRDEDTAVVAIDQDTIHKYICKSFSKGCYGATPATNWSSMVLPIISLLYPKLITSTCASKEKTTLPPLESIVTILDTLEKGKSSLSNNVADLASISSVITEVVYYILQQPYLKHTLSNSFKEQLKTDVLPLYQAHFRNSLIFYLRNSTTLPSNNPRVQNHHVQLRISLTRDLNKFHILSSNEHTRTVLFHLIQDSFWNDICMNVVADQQTLPIKLSELLLHLRKETIETHFIPALKPLVLRIVTTHKKPVVPPFEQMELLRSIFNVCVPSLIIPDVKRFLMNDLLTWMILLLSDSTITTVTLKQHIPSYFHIVKYCLLELHFQNTKSNDEEKEDETNKCWESFLKEILTVASSTTSTPEQQQITLLLILTNAMTIICKCDGLMDTIIPCTTLNEYTTQVFHEYLVSSTTNENDHVTTTSTTKYMDLFIRTCLGLSSNKPTHTTIENTVYSKTLIPSNMISTWIHKLTINNPNDSSVFLKPLFEYAMSHASNTTIALTLQEILQLGIQAWIWGSKDTWVFYSTIYSYISSSTSNAISRIFHIFLVKAVHMLRSELRTSVTESTNDNVPQQQYAVITNQTHWVFCAQRILFVLQNYISQDEDYHNDTITTFEQQQMNILLQDLVITFPMNIMTLFSLDDESLWLSSSNNSSDNSNYIFFCFTHLLEEYYNDDDYSMANYLIDTNTNNGGIQLLFSIIVSISSSELYWNEQDKKLFGKRVDRLFHLLSLSTSSRTPINGACVNNSSDVRNLELVIHDAILFCSNMIKEQVLLSNSGDNNNDISLLYKALHALDYLLQKIGWEQVVVQNENIHDIFQKQLIHEKTKKQQSLIFNNSAYYRPINQHGVQKGDTVWYNRPTGNINVNSFVNCIIVKVHDDNYPNIYFTIQLREEGDGEQQKHERQTVPAKLFEKVTNAVDHTSTTSSQFKISDKDRIAPFCDLIYEHLIEPIWLQKLKPSSSSSTAKPTDIGYMLLKNSNNPCLDIIATCLDILISKCLVFESIHQLQQKEDEYNSVFIKVQNILQTYEQQLHKSLLYSSREKNAPLLLKWSTISFGFGQLQFINTTSSSNNNIMTATTTIPNMTIMHMNPMNIFQTLHQYYSRPFLVKQSTHAFNCSALSWICTLLDTLKMELLMHTDYEKKNEDDCTTNIQLFGNQLLDIIYKISNNLLKPSSTIIVKDENNVIPVVHSNACYYFTSKREISYLILWVFTKVIHLFDCYSCATVSVDTNKEQIEPKEVSQDIITDTNNSKDSIRSSSSSSLGALVKETIPCFINIWEVSEGVIDQSTAALTEGEEKEEIPCVWFQPFASLLHTAWTQMQSTNTDPTTSLAQSLTDGAIPYTEDLLSYLSSSNTQRRWCAFQLLKMIAFSSRRRKAVVDENNADTSTTNTILWDCDDQKLMDHHKLNSTMIKEEMEELDEDIKVTSLWLPPPLMVAIENLGQTTSNDATATTTAEESAVAMGRFLTWLTCLDFLDDAACIDVGNRGSISSYIQATCAVDIILTMAIISISFNKSDVSNNNDYLNQSSKDVWFQSCDMSKTTTTHPINKPVQKEVSYNIPPSEVAKYILLRTAQTLPTLFKTWWKDTCPRSMQMNVSQYVQDHVAPEILKMELLRIHNALALTGLTNMAVNGSCVSREVTASYLKDECQLSVTIRIPPLFPLRNVEVDCQKTLGVPEKRWKHWQLQIMLMLNNQDGSILDALLLWKENVDKEFEGVEPCPVCYSVLCVKTHNMPNLQCKTCNNRFHTSCLYKWFHSSGKNQCVLCQQPWNGFRV